MTTSENPTTTDPNFGDRLNRFKELLTGIPSSVKLQRLQEQLQSNRPRNAMLAVLLHACSRLEQGETLGDIEAKMVSIVGQNHSQEQLKELGRIYQTMTAEQRAAFFPENLANLPLNQTYSQADFKAELKNIAAKMRSEGTVRTVDINQLSADSTTSEDSALRSVSSANVIATNYTASTSRSEQSQGSKYAEIKLTRFQCLHESTEWSNSDEPFFGVAGSSDLGFKTEYRPAIFKDVDKGEYHNFPEPAMAFQGWFNEQVCLNIEIHEKDQGTGWSSLAYALEEVGAALLDGAEELAGEEDCELAMVILEVTGIISCLLGGFFGSFDDDFICERTFSFDRSGLLALNGKEVCENFDGGKAGAYNVYFKVTVRDFHDSQVPYTTPALIFENTNFQGATKLLEAKNYDMKALSSFWHNTKSIQVHDGYQVTLYEYDQFSGRSVTYSSDASSFDDLSQVSSIKIKWNPKNVTLPSSGKAYSIVNKNSGKALFVQNHSMENYGNVAQITKISNYKDQRWFVEYKENGFCQIINEMSGKALFLGGHSTSNEGNISQMTKLDYSDQTWILVPTGSGYFHIISVYSNKALLCRGKEDNANVVQYSKLNYDDQMWKFEPC